MSDRAKKETQVTRKLHLSFPLVITSLPFHRWCTVCTVTINVIIFLVRCVCVCVCVVNRRSNSIDCKHHQQWRKEATREKRERIKLDLKVCLSSLPMPTWISGDTSAWRLQSQAPRNRAAISSLVWFHSLSEAADRFENLMQKWWEIRIKASKWTRPVWIGYNSLMMMLFDPSQPGKRRQTVLLLLCDWCAKFAI